MKKLHVTATFIEPILGTAPKNEEIYRDFIGSKAPDAATVEDEIIALMLAGCCHASAVRATTGKREKSMRALK